jgi:uncharacterized protein
MKADNRLPLPIQDRLAPLQHVFQKTAGVISAYLFGSVAAGVSNRHSDVDFAVLIAQGLNASEKHDIRMHLIEVLEQILGQNVDLVVLNDASLKMIHQVFNHGKPIYVRNNRAEEDFRLKMQKEYFDFQYYIEKERQDLREFYDC